MSNSCSPRTNQELKSAIFSPIPLRNYSFAILSDLLTDTIPNSPCSDGIYADLLELENSRTSPIVQDQLTTMQSNISDNDLGVYALFEVPERASNPIVFDDKFSQIDALDTARRGADLFKKADILGNSIIFMRVKL